MSEENKNVQLIIRQRPSAHPEMETLLNDLQGEFGLEAYTARQRLIGPGLALFGKGGLEKTAKIAGLLRQHGFACWLVNPRPPAFTPERLRNLEIKADSILFECQKGSVRMERGGTVVAVLADLSGALIDKHVKRLLAQNTYRGRDALEVLGRDEMVKTIFRGQPIFDCYLLDAAGDIQVGVRALAGRFNHQGLGSRASMSSSRNLEALVRLVEEYAGDFRLHCDFGLSQLPDCQLKRMSESSAAAIDNLDSLTRYGWLVAGLREQARPTGPQPLSEAALASGVAAAAVIGQPALGAVLAGTNGAETVPGVSEIAQEIRSALDEETVGTDSSTQSSEPTQTSKDLPPPPDRPPARLSWRKALITIGGVLGGFTVTIGSDGGARLLGPVLKYSMLAGVLPGLASAGLFWGGFHFIRLKRRVENTPTSKVRSIAMGLVEVHGQARRKYALVAPMTQSACVYYRLRKYRRDNKNNWQLIRDTDSSHVAFELDDGTGRVVVTPTGASVNAKTRQTGYPGQTPLTFTSVGSASSDEKWVEDIIYEGTSLYVLGFAQPLKEETLSLRERTLDKLRQLKLDPRAMRRYDTDGDGQIDEAEWEAARSDAEQQALQDHLAERNSRKRQEEHVVIGKPPQRSLPFVIAETVSETHLTRKFGLLSIPLLLAGAGIAAFAIYKFLQFVGI